LRAQLDQLGERLVAAVGRQADAQARWRRRESDLAELRGKLELAAGAFACVADRQAAVLRAVQADLALAGAFDELAVALDAADRARRRSEDEALASGFGGEGTAALEAARLAVRAPKDQLRLEQEVAAWATGLTELRQVASAPDLAGLHPELADETRAAAALAVAALDRARQAEQEARSARDTQLISADRLRERLAEVSAAEAGLDTLVTETAPVIYLAGLAKGVDGHRRVALTTYVLRHWFEQVVAAANVRLAVMSSGRYELRRVDEGESRRQRVGLTLSVIDRYTGEERSPRSLSGGEAFYTSLALALGLADVVRAEAGGVDLETLFIDEGFGSLDEQTLDQVLGVIDELRDRGRAVGIVSHVADLKERVTERLEVRRLPDGSSTARVVA
jgi:exonuclease SbcC